MTRGGGFDKGGGTGSSGAAGYTDGQARRDPVQILLDPEGVDGVLPACLPQLIVLVVRLAAGGELSVSLRQPDLKGASCEE